MFNWKDMNILAYDAGIFLLQLCYLRSINKLKDHMHFILISCFRQSKDINC